MEPIYLAPLGILVVFAAVAFFAAKRFGGAVVAVGMAVIAAVALALFVAMSNASGYDGIGYLILLMFGAGPAAAGYLGGGLWGWRRGKVVDQPPL